MAGKFLYEERSIEIGDLQLRLEMIMALMLISISSASAAMENASAGPYNISFDLNTTMNYTVVSQPPVMLLAPNTTEYSIGIWSSNSSWAGVAVFEQENLSDSTNTSDRTVLGLAMLAANYKNVTVGDRIIDGKNGMLAAGEMATGDMIYRAWYWLDSKGCECGPVSVGKVKVEVMSLYPQNITDGLLDTLHVEMPPNVTENVTAENATSANETLVSEPLANETLAGNETLAENATTLDNETAVIEAPVSEIPAGEVPANETVPESDAVLEDETNASATSSTEELINLTSDLNATAAEDINTSATEGISAPL